MDELKDPALLHGLQEPELLALAGEVRKRIIAAVSKNGGHLAPSLGVVELTLALLAEFDLNKDRLVWDVGHQAYSHKLPLAERLFLILCGHLAGFPASQARGKQIRSFWRWPFLYIHFGCSGHGPGSRSGWLEPSCNSRDW